MGIRDVLAYLNTRQAAATPATSEKNMTLQEKPLQIKAVTSATSATSKNTDSRENFQNLPQPGALKPASQEPPELVTERPDPDRWSWPHSEAMTSGEIDAFAGRASQFYRRGMPSVNAEALAYKLVNRDRDGDDRRLCLECAHLTGQRAAWRCDQWKRAGMGAAGIPAGMVLLLQRCDGFRNASR